MVQAAATLTYVTASAPLCRAADTEAAVVGRLRVVCGVPSCRSIRPSLLALGCNLMDLGLWVYKDVQVQVELELELKDEVSQVVFKAQHILLSGRPFHSQCL